MKKQDDSSAKFCLYFWQPSMVRTKSYKKLPYRTLRNLTCDSAVDLLLASGTIIANQNADKTGYKDSTDVGKHMGEISQTTLTIHENFGAVLKLNPSEYTIVVESRKEPLERSNDGNLHENKEDLNSVRIPKTG